MLNVFCQFPNCISVFIRDIIPSNTFQSKISTNTNRRHKLRVRFMKDMPNFFLLSIRENKRRPILIINFVVCWISTLLTCKPSSPVSLRECYEFQLKHLHSVCSYLNMYKHNQQCCRKSRFFSFNNKF